MYRLFSFYCFTLEQVIIYRADILRSLIKKEQTECAKVILPRINASIVSDKRTASPRGRLCDDSQTSKQQEFAVRKLLNTYVINNHKTFIHETIQEEAISDKKTFYKDYWREKIFINKM